jgi:integrase
MRSGELDALRWTKIDFQAGTILVDEQWSAKAQMFTPPKHGVVRTIALTEPARRRLLSLSRESEFVFTTTKGTHYRPSSRSTQWSKVRHAAGLEQFDFYAATRHFFGWYAWNVLELDARDIALQFGHQDGGELVRKLYGHPDALLARERIRNAYLNAPAAPLPLRHGEQSR